MDEPEVAEDQELRITKYPRLRIATGGKGPTEPPDAFNWLSEAEIGTTFVARHSGSKEVDYNQYYVLFKALPKVVLLKWVLPDGKLLDYYVDPVKFSNKYSDYVILGVNKPEDTGTEEPETKAEENGDGNSRERD